jgi:hypothetical protein
MYGLIGKFTAKPGQRDALEAVLLAQQPRRHDADGRDRPAVTPLVLTGSTSRGATR